MNYFVIKHSSGEFLSSSLASPSEWAGEKKIAPPRLFKRHVAQRWINRWAKGKEGTFFIVPVTLSFGDPL